MYREHWSTAPRKGPISQEGRSQFKVKQHIFDFESLILMTFTVYYQEVDQIPARAPRKQNHFSGPACSNENNLDQEKLLTIPLEQHKGDHSD